jgi:enoyl-CoA hydratase/carnithine racemase
VHQLVEVMATQRSHLTQVATKQMVKEIVASGDVSDSLSEHWASEVARTGEDTEGVNAFLEKRAARFPYRRNDS